MLSILINIYAAGGEELLGTCIITNKILYLEYNH